MAPLAACVRGAKNSPPRDEWSQVRAEFDLDSAMINLDNGWTCTPPRIVQEVRDRWVRAIDRAPAVELNKIYRDILLPKVTPALGQLIGVPAREVALVRNATEAIATVLLGWPFAPGDELVCSLQDYWHMLEMIAWLEDNRGVKVRRVDWPIPATTEDVIVDAYAKAITTKTKLVLVTHISNRTGQVMPVARIAKHAHDVGAEVVLDAAQSFAILEHKIPQLDVDYYCTSLHKWLSGPVSTGALWMRPEHVDKIPSRFASGSGPLHPMSRYESFGTVCEALYIAAGTAIEFHNRIGGARKEARVRELVAHLRAGLAKIAGTKFYTVDEKWASCGLLTFELPDRDPVDVQKQLWDQHKVVVQAQAPSNVPAIRGIRVSPAVYTTFDEIDRAVDAIRRVA